MAISDEQKRWMLVGISLHTVLAPSLRHYVEDRLKKHYSAFDRKFGLKALTGAGVQSSADLKSLKFANINNNVAHGMNKSSYSYTINNPVDLAKLYLPAHLARFSNFDDSLDLSAMLRLLGTASIFPSLSSLVSIQAAADEVRENVRNKWGHCNLTEWTPSFYYDCLNALERLVESLGLERVDEAKLKDELRTSKGFVTCMEHMDENLQMIQQEVRDLRQQCKHMDKEFPDLQNKLEETMKRFNQMEEKVENLEQEVEEVKKQGKKVENLEQEVKKQGKKVENLVAEMKREIGEMKQSKEGATHAEKERDDPPLQKEIKNEYKQRHSWIHPFPWLEHIQVALKDVFTRLKIVHRKKGVDGVSGESVGMFEIFKPHKQCERPRRVLVEADPGMGKTTFSEKLCLDWATGNAKQPFPLFPLVIFLKCRDLLSDDIMEAVADQLLPNDVSEGDKAALFKFVEDNQSEILLVVDGMDELGEVDLSALIRRKILSQIHLLVTTRHEAGIKIRQYFDSLFEITGYTIGDAKEYIGKYFKVGEKEEKGVQLLRKINEGIDEDGEAKTQDGAYLKELLSNPLRASLLCAVSEDHGDELPPSRTLLYDGISSCILSTHFKKYQPEAEVPDEPLLHYREDLLTLGKFALRGSEKNQLYFDAKELDGHSSNIGKLGFLSQEPSASKTKPGMKYSFLHRMFQEYFASRYLCHQLVNKEITIEDFIREHSGDMSKFAQIFRFIAGILAGKRATAVLRAFMQSLTREVTALHYDSRFSFCLLCDCVCEGIVGGELSADQKQLCAFIGEEISWQTLLVGGEVAGETSARWKVLCEVMKNLSSEVEELYLNDNQLKDVSLLVSSLQHNTTLVVLDLRGNPIVDFTGLKDLTRDKKLRIGTVSGYICEGSFRTR